MKWILSVFALLILVRPLYGQDREKYQAWCEQGGAQVATQGINSTTRVQRSFPQCRITVFNAGTTDRATIFSDQRTPLGNPFDNQNRATGQYFFFADPGHYDIQIEATGLTTYTLTYVYLAGTGGPPNPNPGMNCGLSQLTPADIATCAVMNGGRAYPQWWGAKADGVILGGSGGGQGCFGNAGSPVISCATANFTAADVGKRFDLAHAGTPNCGPSTYGRGDLRMNCNLVGTIASVQGAQQLTLSTNVLVSVGNQQFVYASSDDAAVQAALDSGIKNIAFVGTYGITGPTPMAGLGNGAVGGVFINRSITAPGPGVGRLLRIGPVAYDGIGEATFVIENGSAHVTVEGLSVWGTNVAGELTSFGPTHDGLTICSGFPNGAVCAGLPGNANGLIDDIRIINGDFSHNWGIGWHSFGYSQNAVTQGLDHVVIVHSSAWWNSYDGFNPGMSGSFVMSDSNASHNGSGGLELVGYSSLTVTGSVFHYNGVGGMAFGGMTDTYSANTTCNITGNDFSENGNGFNDPTGIGGNTIGSGLSVGIGTRNCTISGNTIRHNHYIGLELHMYPKDTNLNITGNIVSTNGLIGRQGLSIGVYGNFNNVTMSGNQIINETYSDIASIGRSNNVVTVNTASAVNFYAGYEVQINGTPDGAFDAFDPSSGGTGSATVETFIDGRTFTYTQVGPDIPVRHYEAGRQGLGQVFSQSGGFDQNEGILVQDCRNTEIHGNTVRYHDFSNVAYIQFLPGGYQNCYFTSDTNTQAMKSTLNATGNRDLYMMSVPPGQGAKPLVPTAGGFVVDVPSMQVVMQACTTAASAGATCTMQFGHGFQSDLDYMLTPDQFDRIKTTCSLENTPVAQTGNPVVLKVRQIDWYLASVTIGTFDGHAAGGGTMKCVTNFNF